MDLDIARGGRSRSASDRMLVIVDERELDPEGLSQRVDEGVGPLPSPSIVNILPSPCAASRPARGCRDWSGPSAERQRRLVEKICLPEQSPRLREGRLLAVRVHALLRDPGEFDLKGAWQVERVVRAPPPLADRGPIHQHQGHRAVGLYSLMRPRLGRDRAADRHVDGRAVRLRKGQSHFR
jgi:hypothetical protein